MVTLSNPTSTAVKAYATQERFARRIARSATAGKTGADQVTRISSDTVSISDQARQLLVTDLIQEKRQETIEPENKPEKLTE